jgi:hypothetical protein
LLTPTEIEAFVTRGFVRIEEAFPRAVAEEGRAHLWREAAAALPGLDADDPSTWTRPVLRFVAPDRPPFRAAGHTERLYEAFDQLAGPGRWRQHAKLGGTVAVRFPHADPPGDDGWHIDGSWDFEGTYWVNVRSRGRALLVLMLFSDVGPDDAPTRIRVGSHLRVPRVLEPAGDDGMPFQQVARRLGSLDALPIEHATGRAGDAYLCHPFLVHAADIHRGKVPRFMAQPELPLLSPFALREAPDDCPPVERAILLGLRPG